VGRRGGVVECGEDTSGPLALDQLAHDGIVKDYMVSKDLIDVTLTFDRRPLDLLPDVFLLLRLEGELDEDLLELLVDVVDAELLKAVVLEDLKPAVTVSNDAEPPTH
jgi:hypothetical protein